MAVEMVEQRSTFEQGIRKWLETEDLTIANCDELAAASDNLLVKTMADIIRSDSMKHKEILGIILTSLDGTITLTPEELGKISQLIDKHVQIEKDSIALATEQYENSRHFVVRELLSYLLEDEKKHYKLLMQMNDFKRKLYPYA